MNKSIFIFLKERGENYKWLIYVRFAVMKKEKR